MTLTFWGFDFSRARCCDCRSSIVGNGIAVGSSIAGGDLAGVGLAGAVAALAGVGAPSGRSKRPRLCDTAGDVAEEATGIEVTFGTGVCANDVATRAISATDNAKDFRMPSEGFVESSVY